MLPGFRFLFAAIVLSMSVLIFGFGAAALLRTAHEEFANTPTWQPAPETRFAQSREASQSASPPVLAMLRVDDTPKDASNDAPKIDQPASDNAAAAAPTDQVAAIAALPSEPSKSPSQDKIAALQPADRRPKPLSRKPGYRRRRSRNSPPQAEAVLPPAVAEASARLRRPRLRQPLMTQPSSRPPNQSRHQRAKPPRRRSRRLSSPRLSNRTRQAEW